MYTVPNTHIARSKINHDSDCKDAASSYVMIYVRSRDEHVAAHMLVWCRFLGEEILQEFFN